MNNAVVQYFEFASALRDFMSEKTQKFGGL